MVGEYRVLWLRLSELVTGTGKFGILCDMVAVGTSQFDLDLCLFQKKLLFTGIRICREKIYFFIFLLWHNTPNGA
jgi:hypothetical protein